MGSMDPTAGILSGVGGMFTQMMADDSASDRQEMSYQQNSALQKQSAELQLSNWKDMQSSAHQLEIEDLKKAGLNPILSATNGHVASAGSVGTPSVSSASPQSNNFIQNAIATAVQAKQAQRAYEIQLGQLKVEQTNAETEKVNAQANLQNAISNSAKNYSDIDLNLVRSKQMLSDIDNARSLLSGQLDLMKKQGAAADAQAAAGFANAAQAHAFANKALAEAKLIAKDLDLYNSPEYREYTSKLLAVKTEIANGNLKDAQSKGYKAIRSFGNYLDALFPGDRSSIRMGRFGSIGSISQDSGGSK